MSPEPTGGEARVPSNPGTLKQPSQSSSISSDADSMLGLTITYSGDSGRSGNTAVFLTSTTTAAAGQPTCGAASPAPFSSRRRATIPSSLALAAARSSTGSTGLRRAGSPTVTISGWASPAFHDVSLSG